jgi:hypothetical protein
MIFSYPLPFCYSGYDQLVMELITSQVEEAAGSRPSPVGREILSAPPARGSQAVEGSHPPPGSGRRQRRPGRTVGRRPAGELDLSSAPGGPASSPGGTASSPGAAAAGWRGREPSSGVRAQVRPAGAPDQLPPVPWILKLGPPVEKTRFREGFFAKFKFNGLGRRRAI